MKVESDQFPFPNLSHFVSLSFLTHDHNQVLLTLLADLGHLGLGDLQLLTHDLHLLGGVIDLEQTIAQFGDLIPQLGPLLGQQSVAIYPHALLSAKFYKEIFAGGKAVVNYDNPKWVHILNVSFLTISINFGVLLCKSVLHLLRFSVFIYARRLCSLQRFGTISSFSYKIAPLNSGPSFPLQTSIVSLRMVPFLN